MMSLGGDILKRLVCFHGGHWLTNCSNLGYLKCHKGNRLCSGLAQAVSADVSGVRKC